MIRDVLRSCGKCFAIGRLGRADFSSNHQHSPPLFPALHFEVPHSASPFASYPRHVHPADCASHDTASLTASPTRATMSFVPRVCLTSVRARFPRAWERSGATQRVPHTPTRLQAPTAARLLTTTCEKRRSSAKRVRRAPSRFVQPTPLSAVAPASGQPTLDNTNPDVESRVLMAAPVNRIKRGAVVGRPTAHAGR